MPLKKYATFSGRAPRAEYWWFYLGSVVVSFALSLLDRAVGTDDVIGAIFNLAVLVPSLAVTVRRLHDIDRSGWWLLALVAVFGFIGLAAVLDGGSAGQSSALMFTTMIVAVVGVILVGITMLAFMVQRGTEGPNRYGDDPYGPDQLEEVFA